MGFLPRKKWLPHPVREKKSWPSFFHLLNSSHLAFNRWGRARLFFERKCLCRERHLPAFYLCKMARTELFLLEGGKTMFLFWPFLAFGELEKNGKKDKKRALLLQRSERQKISLEMMKKTFFPVFFLRLSKMWLRSPDCGLQDFRETQSTMGSVWGI